MRNNTKGRLNITFERDAPLHAGIVPLAHGRISGKYSPAVHSELYPWAPPLSLWLRLSLQGVLIARALVHAARFVKR